MKRTFLLLAINLLSINLFGQWTQQGADIDGESAGDFSGYSVSMSADGLTVAIGADRNNGNGTWSGHVRVYKLISGTWTQQGVDIDGEAADDYSGQSVSMSADGLTVAIGAPFNDDNGLNSGHVRVFKLNSGTWTQHGADIDGESPDDRSGQSVSMSADGLTVAIGAPYNAGNGIKSGHVRVYKLISGTWIQQGTDINGEAANDESGESVSISADGLTVAIGAPRNNGNGTWSGHVRVYKSISGTWTQQGVDIDGEAADDYSGQSVSMSADGMTIAIGATINAGNGTYSGHVRVYKLISGLWTQLGADIDGEATFDYSGESVGISNDGLTVIVGAALNNGNGTYSGHVRVYQLISGLWTQQGTDIDGEAADDYSGWSSSMSADGSTVAIGALKNDGNGIQSGHVRVYKFDSTSTSVKIVRNPSFNNLYIFPNPSNGLINLDLGDLKVVSIDVRSVTGQLIYSNANVTEVIHQFEISGPSGLYFIEIVAEGNRKQYKLMMK